MDGLNLFTSFSPGNYGWQRLVSEEEDTPFKLSFTYTKDGEAMDVPFDTPASLFNEAVWSSTTLHLGSLETLNYRI